jgi:hypothetical protein
MALRDQPYLPLYVQDFITDEKLIECSASTTGVYIRIMCLMHKSEEYGTILLKQKHKQSEKQSLNFASQLAKSLPYNLVEIESAILELLSEKVLEISADYLIQKRMVKDNEISIKRSISGSKGGNATQSKDKKPLKKIAKAKSKANTEYESEYEIEYDFDKSSNEFKTYFLNEFITSPKQKKKSKELLIKILIDLQSYDEPFAIGLMKNSVLNNWQGYKFDKTDEQYADYLRKKQNGNSPQWTNGATDAVPRKHGKQSFVLTESDFLT